MDMESTLANSISNVVLQTQSLADAFKSMVDAIIRELIRLQVQKAFVSLFGGAANAAAGGGVSASAGEEAGSLFGPAPTFGSPVVNQQVNFNLNAIDSQSGTDFILSQGNAIAGVVGEAINQSSGYAAELGGA